MRRFGVRMRLFLAAGLPALLAILVLVPGFLSHYERAMHQTLREHVASAARQVASAAEFPLFAGNQAALRHLVEGARQSDSHVAAVSIWTPDGRLLLADGRALDARRLAELEPGRPVQIGQRLVALAQVRSTVLEDPGLFGSAASAAVDDRRNLLGYALVELELSVLQRQRQELWGLAFVAAGGSLLVAGLLSTAIAASVTRPLARIAQAVSRISERQLGVRIDPDDTGVLRDLAEGINTMAVRLAQNEAQLQQRVQQATDELRRQKEAAERSARTDSLTGLLNRRAFAELAEREIERARRFHHPLSLIAIDLDRFKAINDGHGHAVGDAVLEHFARVASAQLRSLDAIARLGGEEFVILLPETDAQGAFQLAERMRLAVAAHPLPRDGEALRYTASFGVAGFEPRQPVLERWLARADAALYEAKGRGRNRVELAPGPGEPGFQD